jgi:hypothetical protein
MDLELSFDDLLFFDDDRTIPGRSVDPMFPPDPVMEDPDSWERDDFPTRPNLRLPQR